MKKVLLIRLGAYGDCLVITPVIREFKKQGYYVGVLASERGNHVFENNPNIDELLFQPTDEVEINKLQPYWDKVAEDFKADKVINFSESLEVALAVHPRSPRYNWTKEERRRVCNISYYKFSMMWAKLESDNYKPELFFTSDERKEALSHIKKDKFNILMCMSGSGKHKAYPHMEILTGTILNEIKDAHIITVGDLACKIIESCESGKITNLAGEVGIRTSLALTEMVDLVISPDTGVLHAAGCYATPKIGLLGHTTKENITKYFENDYSVESNPFLAECSPCFRMIYKMKQQCPVDPHTGGSYCMSKGLLPEVVFEQVRQVYRRR